MRLQPMEGKIIAKVMRDGGHTTKSGLFIPPQATENQRFVRAEVTATGGKKYLDGKLVDMKVKVGDTVLFDEFTTREFTVDGEKFYLVKGEDDLYGTIVEDGA